MSQISKSVSSTPSVATSYVTDVSGPAIPQSNSLSVIGGTAVSTDGSVAGTVTINLTDSVATSFASDSGSATPSSNILTLSGGVNVQTSASGSTITINAVSEVTSKTGAYTAGADDYFINCTANTFTVTLPKASSLSGKIYQIKNSGNGTITIDGDGSETIDGDLNQSLIQDESMTIISNGSNWFII